VLERWITEGAVKRNWMPQGAGGRGEHSARGEGLVRVGKKNGFSKNNEHMWRQGKATKKISVWGHHPGLLPSDRRAGVPKNEPHDLVRVSKV